jgi:hypothetical protein
MPTIPQLPSIVQLGSSDVFAVSANGVTYKCTGAQLTAALASIGEYITEDQLANNLTTTAEGLALDARQGKALSDALAVLDTTVVRYGEAQQLTADQQNTARGNIGAASGTDMTAAQDDIDSLQTDAGQLKINALLLHGEIPNTTQTIAFNQTTGDVSTITHARGNTVIRTDAFTFAEGSITEARTLNTGESLTIVTNTETLVTTVTYAAA